MCGIAGLVDTGAGFGRSQLRALATAMADRLTHRGPDDTGVWADDTCALAHRRLSILDLRPDGRQPMANEDGSVQVTFNGEIYNYRELRATLASQGHRFHTQTDTEVLPHLFESMDPAALRQLDGMFGLGVWHAQRRQLLLARDPFGKKPLYTAHGPGWFAFASELHALHGLPGIDTTVDRDALAHYLLVNYVPAPATIWRGARKLPPGSSLTLDLSRQRPVEAIRRYWRFQPTQPDFFAARSSFDDRVEQLRHLLIRAVEKRLAADVPLGAFLSGGVDSSLVVAILARELGVPVRTFSIGFTDGGDETEHEHARAVANHLGTDHHEEVLRPDIFETVTEIAGRLDEPNGDSSCLPTFLLSRFARDQVTVALSGDGGDEVFGGYRRYQATLQECADWRGRIERSRRERRWFTAADSYLSPFWLARPVSRVATLFGEVPPGLARQLGDWRRQLNRWWQPLLHRLRAIDAEYYLPGAVLPKVDRMSMQVALEVRCPLLDRDVAAFAANLAADDCFRAPDESKRILKRVAERYLPAEWLRRTKMGFGVPTIHWSLEGLWTMARDLLLASDSPLAAEVQRPALRELLAHESQPGCGAIYQVWPLLIMELWLRRMRDASGTNTLSEPAALVDVN